MIIISPQKVGIYTQIYLNLICKKDNKTIEDYNIVIVTDDNKIAKKVFNFLPNSILADVEDIVKMFIMVYADKCVIAASTFAWWGAWLNDNKNKIVTIPSLWFGPAKGNTPTKDIYSEGWVKI